MGNTTSITNGINVTGELGKLGFKPVNLFDLLGTVTHSFDHVIQYIFAWVYFLSEIGILVGALAILTGAIIHSSRVKRTGGIMALYSIIGFLTALLLPGLIIGLYQSMRA